MDTEETSIHAPTVTCELMRAAASVIETASKMLPGELIFFPPREESEQQPVQLEGYVALIDIAGLVRYISDMLEV